MKVQDNGVHEFVEDAEILVLRNHGSKHWCGMMKYDGGGYRVLTFAKRLETAIKNVREIRQRVLKLDYSRCPKYKGIH